MKKTTLPLCILFILLLFFCCSCGFFGPQRYICEIEEVESVQIIRLDEYIPEEYRFDYTVLSEIADTPRFVNRLNELEHSVNWGEPSQMYAQYIVIRIDFHNGDFDLIYPNAQCFHRDGVSNYGYFFFNEEEFNALISDYLTE